jgi:hypothetical protein
VKQLLEKNTGTGRGRKEDGQSIRLSSAQRQALEKVIRPSSTRLVVVAHRQGEKKRTNPRAKTVACFHTLLCVRRRGGFSYIYARTLSELVFLMNGSIVFCFATGNKKLLPEGPDPIHLNILFFKGDGQALIIRP